METINEINTVKIEKQKAMHRYRTFQKIAYTFRALEISVIIIFTSISIYRTSSHVPATFELSAEFLRRLLSILTSPRFVFVVGNVIIIILFANFSSIGDSDDVVQNFDDLASGNADAMIPATESPVVVKEVFRRSKSLAMVEDEVVEKRELRRSVTVPRRKCRGGDLLMKAAAEARWRRREEDGLSKEEFNSKVEEFIVKQRRFLCDEAKALVLSN